MTSLAIFSSYFYNNLFFSLYIVEFSRRKSEQNEKKYGEGFKTNTFQ